MLFNVKIGAVSVEATAIGKVEITFINGAPADIWHISHLSAIGKPEKSKFWLHFKNKHQWDNFYYLWIKLEKPWILRVNPNMCKFYTAKGA